MKSIEKLLVHCWTMKDASLEAGQSIKRLKNDIRNKEECWTISSQMKKTWDGWILQQINEEISRKTRNNNLQRCYCWQSKTAESFWKKAYENLIFTSKANPTSLSNWIEEHIQERCFEEQVLLKAKKKEENCKKKKKKLTAHVKDTHR